ncbi:MAG: hypothetical protein ABJM29_15690 [Rhizobiaceae bacterium]
MSNLHFKRLKTPSPDRMARLLNAYLDEETRQADLDFATHTLSKIDEVTGLHDSLKSVFAKL